MKKYKYSPDKYLSELYSQTYRSPYEGVSGKEAIEAISQRTRARLAEIFALDKIPAKIESLRPVVVDKEDRGTYQIETLCTEICKGLNMLSYLLTPKQPSGRAVIAVCGHGYGVRQIVRKTKHGAFRRLRYWDNYQKDFAIELAMAGNTVIAPELIGFGEAKLAKDAWIPCYSNSCEKISMHLLLYGLTTASLRVYQVQRCLDILKGYGYASAGCMGISGGGLVALYSACLDERIDTAVISGYISTFYKSILNVWHCPDNYIPNLLEVGEMCDFAATLAPKKLLIEAGSKDKLFAIEGVRQAVGHISRIYKELGAEGNFVTDIFEGGHKVSGRLAFNFFNKEQP